MMMYPLAFYSWDQEEHQAIQRVLLSGRYTMGPQVAAFEREFAEYLGAEHTVMVNSGSTANLLAVTALMLEGKLKPGDEVIVPAVSWSTTYFPLHQLGLRMRFVDVDPLTFNIAVEQVYDALTPDTRAVFAVNLLGNPCDLDLLTDCCLDHNLSLLVDNCESLGAVFDGQEAGTFGNIGTYSFFFSHHMQTMEGGMVVAHNQRTADTLCSLRAHGWTRDLSSDSPIYQRSEDWFDESFKFILPGYSVRPLEMSGAVGREQLKKLPDQLAQRRRNAEVYRNEIMSQRWASPCYEPKGGRSSWFGFPVVLCGPLTGHRYEVVNELRKFGIETRPVVAGNFLRHPVAKLLNIANPNDPFPVADDIHDNGFFLGNSGLDLTEQIEEAAYWIEQVAQRHE